MKLDPGFLNHWKTERLIDQLGADGVLAVLRLWGAAQIRRQFTGLQLTPKRLAMETKWRGDADRLFSVLTDQDAPWIDVAPDGSFTIHGFEEHQHQVVKLWENGKKGGRPKKSSSSSSSSSSTSSSSSSSPICEPNGNHMVFPLALDTDAFKAKWSEWQTYRKQSKMRRLTPASVAKKLTELSSWGEAEAIAAIDSSIGNAWTGIFRSKQNSTEKRKPSLSHEFKL